MAHLHDSIVTAILSSGKTRYRIAKEAGLAQSQLSRLVHGKAGMSIDALEKLATTLGYELQLVRSKKRKAR